MKTSSSLMKSQFHLTRIITTTNPSFLTIPSKTTSYLKHLPPQQSARLSVISRQTPKTRDIIKNRPLSVLLESKRDIFQVVPDGFGRRFVVVGAVSIGFVLLLMGFVDEQKALAFGPEGPMVEEFWENVRRYGLYALTVSTGALYTILLPIFELLKNPISALLLLVILGGSFFIISQVLSAMVGVTEFSYDYQY
ncbi:hypothetical protein LWI28_023210 [Acer negundo]|uniref:Uncharacterized protein ycf33 n=1 Tax=Acer negundo TaxID=4023 RepID=A0AAD5NKG7_ACENE|nr:hypothetical protein LWI28_023210 [Acer negundo]KAK4839429.1 hypothetical protein QYF36_021877 [Acer negundo]